MLWFKILSFKVTFANTPVKSGGSSPPIDHSFCGLSKLLSVGCVVSLIS